MAALVIGGLVPGVTQPADGERQPGSRVADMRTAALPAPAVPCKDARGCPDLILNGALLHAAHLTTETFSASDCAVQEGEVGATGTRRLLVFPYQTPNMGPGALIIGDPLDPANSAIFEFAPCHQHFHFRKYAAYRLWRPADYARFQQLKVEHPDMLSADIIAAGGLAPILGTKKGFCVADALPAPGFAGTRDPRTYLSCGTATEHGNQGLGLGWADEYSSRVPGQWIDVTDVADGDYVLDVETNPDRLFQEARYDDNSASVPVRINH
jgi:hypothetical protein